LREVVLTLYNVHVSKGTIRRVDVAGIFRPPAAPADAAAAAAALAGVTHLEIRGRDVERGDLAAALLHLPGLREVSLSFASEVGGEREADELGADLVAALAACPSIESLKWEVTGWLPSGALGPRGGRAWGLGALGGPRGRGASRRPPICSRARGGTCAVGALWGNRLRARTRVHAACVAQ
jgi:hypothetical protein